MSESSRNASQNQENGVAKIRYAGEPVAKAPGESITTLIHVTMPDELNPYGVVHGASMFKIMDNCGGICANRHAGGKTMTVNVDGLRFFSPVQAGEIVNIKAKPAFASAHMLEIRVTAVVEDIFTGESRLALEGFFDYVAVDAEGNVLPMSPLVGLSDDEQRLFDGRAQIAAERKRRQASAS